MELMLVMVVASILGALAVARLSDRQALEQRAAAEELRALLRSARATALAQERDVCVVVAPGLVRAVYAGAAGCDLARPLGAPAGNGEMRIAAPTGLAFGGDPVVRFSARGSLVPAADRQILLGTQGWRIERSTGSVS